MKRISTYLKMRVLGALEYADGNTDEARYRAVSLMIFKDEEGNAHQFTWRTIQTWWYHYRRHGITEAPARADKGATRKVAPEELVEDDVFSVARMGLEPCEDLWLARHRPRRVVGGEIRRPPVFVQEVVGDLWGE